MVEKIVFDFDPENAPYKPGLRDPESNALTMRPRRLPISQRASQKLTGKGISRVNSLSQEIVSALDRGSYLVKN